jgi:gamma-tubulin complex component 2
MSKYQAIFRQLFYLRHVERALCQSWQTHQATKELFACRRDPDDPDLKLIYRAYGLRQRMLHLVQTLQWYMTATVIEPQYALFEQELMRATTVEDLIHKHDKFLDSLLGQCMLRVEEATFVHLLVPARCSITNLLVLGQSTPRRPSFLAS